MNPSMFGRIYLAMITVAVSLAAYILTPVEFIAVTGVCFPFGYPWRWFYGMGTPAVKSDSNIYVIGVYEIIVIADAFWLCRGTPLHNVAPMLLLGVVIGGIPLFIFAFCPGWKPRKPILNSRA
jgi:hypothetical protein